MSEKFPRPSLPHPFGAGPAPQDIIISCPVCSSTDFDAKQNQYETFRTCNKCGNRWSGGTMASAYPGDGNISPPGLPAPDDDLPVTQYTGAGFRDPGKTFGGDDW